MSKMPASKNPDSVSTPWAAVPWLLGIGSFSLYVATMSRDLVPGMPVRVLNAVCGLDPLPLTTHQLYSIQAHALVSILPGPALLILNVFSALCAAFSVLAIYMLLIHAPLDPAPRVPHAGERQRRARRIAGLYSSLFLALAVPFWHAATRPGSLTFDLALLLGTLWLLQTYTQPDRGKAWLLAAALLYGLGVTEYATLIPLAPLFGLALLVALLRRGSLNAVTLLQIFAAGCAGLLFYLSSLYVIAQTPDFGYGQFRTPWHVIVDVWKHQYQELRAANPRVGGLLVLLATYVPWVYVLFMTRPRHGGNLLNEFAIVASLLLLTALGGALVLEFHLSPYRLMGGAPILLPYVSTATWLGFLAGYWYLYAGAAATTSIRLPLLRWIGMTAFLLVIVLPIAAGALNFRRHVAFTTHPITAFARNIATTLGSRGTLFSSGGTLDDLIRHLTWREGKEIEIMARPNFQHAAYRNYLSSRFPDAGISGLPADAHDELARRIMAAGGGNEACWFLRPEMAMSLGYQYEPLGLLTRPIQDISALHADAVYTANHVFFAGPCREAVLALQQGSSRDAMVDWLLQEYSRCANNAGAVLLLLRDDQRAMELFDLATGFFPDNPSAHLNRSAVHAHRATEAGASDAVREQEEAASREALAQAVESARTIGFVNQSPITLVSRFGFVHSSALTIASAEAYRQGGHAHLYAASVAQAQIMNPESADVKVSTGRLALSEGDAAEAAAAYEELIAEHPDHVPTLISLAVSYQALDQTGRAIALLEKPGVPKEDVRISSLLSVLHGEGGSHEEAERYFEQSLKVKEKDTQSLGFLALQAFKMERYDLARGFAEDALKRSPQVTHLFDLLVRIEEMEGNYERAATLLESLIASTPGSRALLARSLSLNMRLGKSAEARRAAQELLRMDASDVLAHFALAEIALSSDRYEEAESHLRFCVTNREDPNRAVALNNLAYCLVQLGRAGEALPFAKEAVELQPTRDTFHHTLATAYLAEGRHTEAEDEILRALVLAPDGVRHKLVRAEVLAATGRIAEARAVVTEILPDLEDAWRLRGKALLGSGDGDL